MISQQFFPRGFLEIFQSLEKLELRLSSYEEIFHSLELRSSLYKEIFSHAKVIRYASMIECIKSLKFWKLLILSTCGNKSPKWILQCIMANHKRMSRVLRKIVIIHLYTIWSKAISLFILRGIAAFPSVHIRS